jgi:RNA polymerase sigma factor (sigma-70 family)
LCITWRSATDIRELLSAAPIAEVIRQARHRDEEALVVLYQRALPVIYRYVLARLGRPDLVEDVVADVFLVMVESISDLRTEHEAGFFAWLIQIAQGKISRALRHLTRTEKRQTRLVTDPESMDYNAATEPIATDLLSNPVALQEWRETLEALGLALGNLSAEQQVVVVGRFLAGQSSEELAEALGKRPGAVRALQFRALGVLAHHLGHSRTQRQRGKGGPS